MVEDELSKMRPIAYTARDGVPIQGYFTEPQRVAPGKPLIVYPHGGPTTRDRWTFDPWVQYFASLGYAVIQPNYRMSTGYGAIFFRKGLRETGYKIQDDIVDALKWAQAQGYGTGGNVCIVGGSYGAYAAMRAATSDPETFRCVIAIAGFYDVRRLLQDDAKKPFYPLMKYIYGDPSVDDARLAGASTLNNVERLTAPVLVVHGEFDERIPVTHATELIAQLTAHHKVHEVMILPDEGHSIYKSSNRRRVMETRGAFLRRYLSDER
jgi:dipeptidyl aminopeptidase/acylaminoacyl peptidase